VPISTIAFLLAKAYQSGFSKINTNTENIQVVRYRTEKWKNFGAIILIGGESRPEVSGFRLGPIPCLVTPPSLVPQEYGNRVKTDRRDSRKLAHLLAKGLLKRVWYPVRRNFTTARSSADAGNSSETGCAPRAASRQS
jgi:hypothetical protein